MGPGRLSRSVFFNTTRVNLHLSYQFVCPDVSEIVSVKEAHDWNAVCSLYIEMQRLAYRLIALNDSENLCAF